MVSCTRIFMPSCHSLYADEFKQELMPFSSTFLCPFLDRSLKSACCFGKPVRAPEADDVVIIGIINVRGRGFAMDDTFSRHCSQHSINFIELKIEIGNVSKRQQPDYREDNSRRSPIGLQCSEKFPHPEASFSWPLYKYIY